MKLGLIAVAALALAGCASTGSTALGPNHYAPTPEGAPMAVYMKEADVGCPFEPVAFVHRYDPGKYRRLSLPDAMPYLYEEARSHGANGIIVDEQQVIVSGIFSRGIEVKGRAIRATCAIGTNG